MAVLLDVLHELLVFFRGPGALLETILITARRPSHWKMRWGRGRVVQVGRRETTCLQPPLALEASCPLGGWSPEHSFRYIKTRKTLFPEPRLYIVYMSTND